MRRVYVNVDDALPLYLKEVHAQGKTAADVAGQVKVQLGAAYEAKVGGLLFGINELNASAQTQLRAAYLVFASAPCEQLDYLKDKIDEVSRREHTLRSVAIVLTQLQSLLSANNLADGEGLIDRYLLRAMELISEQETTAALVKEMAKVGQRSIEWKQQ